MLSEDIIIEIQEDTSACSRNTDLPERTSTILQLKSCLKKPSTQNIDNFEEKKKKNHKKSNQKKRKRSNSKVQMSKGKQIRNITPHFSFFTTYLFSYKLT